MTEQTYQDYLSVIRVTLSDSTVIVAPCCSRRKPVFAMRARPTPVPELELTDVGFLCDSCTIERVRAAMSLLDAFYSLIPTDEDWVVVRHERNMRLVWTDQYDIDRIRAVIDPTKLAEIDAYRTWLRNLPDEFDNPADALLAIANTPIPS